MSEKGYANTRLCPNRTTCVVNACSHQETFHNTCSCYHNPTNPMDEVWADWALQPREGEISIGEVISVVKQLSGQIKDLQAQVRRLAEEMEVEE